MNRNNKQLIYNTLSKSNAAIKKFKKQYNLTGKDIEILSACSILTDTEVCFSAKEVREFMGNSYYSADIAYSLLKLYELELIDKVNDTRQWFQPYTYNITGKGMILLDKYCKMCV
jgi:predicted transcriptional regulator